MKINYFDDTDTLYIEFNLEKIVETKELDDNTLLDLDKKGEIVGITVEHASIRADIGNLTLTGLAA